MKRLLLPTSALVLVLTACGAGHVSAPRVTHVAGRQHTLAPHTKSAAAKEAQALLAAFRPPHGAVPLQRLPAGYHWPLKDPGQGIYGKRVDRHRLWRVHDSVR